MIVVWFKGLSIPSQLVNAEYLDLAAKFAGLATALVGFVVALVQAFGAFGDKALEEAVSNSTLSDENKKRVKSCIARRRAPWIALGLVTLTVSGFVIWNLVSHSGKQAFSRSLAQMEPELFRSSTTGLYDTARVFPDKQSIDEDSHLEDILIGARSEIGLFSDHGVSIVDMFKDDLLQAVHRGVRVRVVLLHPSMLESNNYDGVLAVTRQGKDLLRGKIESSFAALEGLGQSIAQQKTSFPGSIEIRLLKKPVIFRMWIRDPASEATGMVHISVLQYRGKMVAPSFRATKRTSEKLVAGLASEFEAFWADAVPAN